MRKIQNEQLIYSLNKLIILKQVFNIILNRVVMRLFIWGMLLIGSLLQAEIKTTADPEIYNKHEVVALSEEHLLLANGSLWSYDQSEMGLIDVGQEVRVIDFFGKKNAKLLFGDRFLKVTLIEFPSTAENIIEKIEMYYWLGEIYYVITLNDGSQWLFDYFAWKIRAWQKDDKILIMRSGGNFYMYNLNASMFERIVFYSITENYHPWENNHVWLF